ncbi:MAG TPA: diguanylate cyclase [Acidimicrobiales bacterium]|nr:diguanylate cyclase [Acidimicrobiales bacterium]
MAKTRTHHRHGGDQLAARTARRAMRPVAWVVLVLGMAGSVVTGVLWRDYLVHEAGQAFDRTAASVSTSLTMQLRREGDLAATIAAQVATNPGITNAEFTKWVDAVHAGDRYPGVTGFGFVERVPADQLAAFTADQAVDPIGGTAPPGGFRVLPPGARPFYCLGRIGVSEPPGTTPLPTGYDVCTAPGIAQAVNDATDTAQLVAVPFLARVGLIVPVYRTPTPPPLLEARRGAIVGWVGVLFSFDKVLATALAGQPSTHLRVVRRNASGTEAVLGEAGPTAHGAVHRTIAVEADGWWILDISAPPNHFGVSPAEQGVGVALGGTAVSVLLFLLLRVLVTSRAKAMLLVEERTGELRYQALHDTLTGLPNRALIMDRVERMLARSRRAEAPFAALFVDLDNFKDINDSLGHAAGDEVLRGVAGRLQSVVRASDTVGRLGGDEFIVLAEGESLAHGPDVLAARLLDVVREPFVVGTGDGHQCTVTASIGIAVGDHGSADGMLRDADIALYQAKAGKDRFVVFGDRAQLEAPTA